MARSNADKAPRAEWLPNTAKKFITALRKEKQHGRMVENGFKAVAWTNAAKVLREDLSINYTVSQLKNQWTKLRGQYKNLVELRQQSGFGWDGDRFMVTATDDVWEPLLEKHSKFRWFRTHPFPLFDDLSFLCENTFATGEHAFAVGGAPEPPVRDAAEDVEDSDGTEGENGVDEGAATEGEVAAPSAPQVPATTPTTPARPPSSSASRVADETEWRSASFSVTSGFETNSLL